MPARKLSSVKLKLVVVKNKLFASSAFSVKLAKTSLADSTLRKYVSADLTAGQENSAESTSTLSN